MSKKLLTLVLVQQDDRLLLGMKKRGFGTGRWNGFGGKLEEGEDLERAAIREAQEEAGITPLDLQEMGVLDFEFLNNPEILEVHIFKATKFEGGPRETEEMRPKWFKINEIPYDEMWSDDIHWLPLLLDDKTFNGRFLFDENDQILSHELEENL